MCIRMFVSDVFDHKTTNTGHPSEDCVDNGINNETTPHHPPPLIKNERRNRRGKAEP